MCLKKDLIKVLLRARESEVAFGGGNCALSTSKKKSNSI